eukprot:jgi/Tetstr1/422722/TSEL_013519.t1
MPPAFSSLVKKTAISGQERFLRRWHLRLQRATPRHNRATPRSPKNTAGRRQPATTVFNFRAPALVGAINPPLQHVVPGCLRSLGTQLAGANVPPLHNCASIAFAAPDTQSVGAIRPPLHHVARPLSRPAHAAVRLKHAVSAPCALAASACLGAQLVGVVRPTPHNAPPAASAACARSWLAPTGRHCTMCPGRLRDMRTQLVGTNGPPLHHAPWPLPRPGHAAGRRR